MKNKNNTENSNLELRHNAELNPKQRREAISRVRNIVFRTQRSLRENGADPEEYDAHIDAYIDYYNKLERDIAYFVSKGYRVKQAVRSAIEVFSIKRAIYNDECTVREAIEKVLEVRSNFDIDGKDL